MKELFKGQVFGKACRKDPDFLKRLVLIEGDLQEKNLGISEDDINFIINNVQIILHVAADVRFDQPLKSAVMHNVRPVFDVMTLAEKIKQLEVIIYMSTAYSQNDELVEEKFYGTVVDPLMLINYVEGLDEESEEIINMLTPRLIFPWESTYSFTKALSEEVVRRFGDKLPVAVIRPSIGLSKIHNSVYNFYAIVT